MLSLRCLKHFSFFDRCLRFWGSHCSAGWEHFDCWSLYRKGCYKFCEPGWKGLCCHNGGTIIEGADFYNRSSRAQLRANLFFRFPLNICATGYFGCLVLGALHFKETVTAATEFVFGFLQCSRSFWHRHWAWEVPWILLSTGLAGSDSKELGSLQSWRASFPKAGAAGFNFENGHCRFQTGFGLKLNWEGLPLLLGLFQNFIAGVRDSCQEFDCFESSKDFGCWKCQKSGSPLQKDFKKFKEANGAGEFKYGCLEKTAEAEFANKFEEEHKSDRRCEPCCSQKRPKAGE